MAPGRRLLLSLALSLLVALSAAKQSFVVVDTTFGAVRGLSDDNGLRFLGLPFAQPPVGPLRWRAPQPVHSHTLVNRAVDGTQFGPACLQAPDASLGVPISEDCLYINVFAPLGTTNSSNHPVMLWIHGSDGTWASGTGATFLGDSLAAAHQFVVVTFNYRLGALGFLTTTDLLKESTTVNYGIQDQQMALQWVQANIASFGGNPSNVLLFGQSNGATSIAYHLLLQKSWNTYSKVAMESVAGLSALQNSVTVAKQYSAPIATLLGCDKASNVLNCLRQAQGSAVLAKLTDIPALPVLDAQMTDQPLKLFSQRQFNNHVPVIIGENQNEGNLWAYFEGQALGLPSPWAFTEAQFVSIVKSVYPTPSTWQQIVKLYGPVGKDSGYFDAVSQFFGDAIVDCSTNILSQYIYNGSVPMWRYLFTHATAQWALAPLGPAHNAELSYVWNQPSLFNTTFSAKEAKLVTTVVNYWANFLRFGDPNGRCLEGANCGLVDVTWPNYDGDVGASVVTLDVLSIVGVSPTKWQFCTSFWLPVLCPTC